MEHKQESLLVLSRIVSVNYVQPNAQLIMFLHYEKFCITDVSFISGVNKGLKKNDLHIHIDVKEDLLHCTSII